MEQILAIINIPSNVEVRIQDFEVITKSGLHGKQENYEIKKIQITSKNSVRSMM